MAVSKRRISQKCRKTEDTDIPSDNEEEGIRFDPNKKVLRARRRNERGPTAKVSLIGSEPPRYSMDQKLKGLNHSFIQSVTLAYNKDNTYNFSSISSQYTKYREEIVEREGVHGTSLLNTTQRQNMADILRAGLGQTTPSKPPMDQDQMKKAEFILGQHGSIGAGLFGAAALNRQKEEERAALDVSQTEKKQETAKRSESMPSSPKKVAQKEDTHKAESADEVNLREPKETRESKGETKGETVSEPTELAPGKSEKQKTPSSPKKDVHQKEAHKEEVKELKSAKSKEAHTKEVNKDSHHKEAHKDTTKGVNSKETTKDSHSKEVSKETTKDSKETKNSHSKDPHQKEVKTKDSHSKEVSNESVKSGDKTKSNSLFDMTCKVFVRNTSRFEDLGFHRVAVKEVQGKRTIIVYDNKKKKETEMISVSLDKTSIQSDRSRKELAFVEPSSTLLYKIKLATLEDATALRRACNSENTSSTK
ncbi:hypothetical protein NEAUS04_0949 [Nematocida ausubeli]|uniref:Uncharacterized protein n=1 Tax=Nematocida ausubeli (strain ATCC PRA-371 / ERTm2) TaxID=1913371 RepID=A0A086J5F2_NEMA1|nr:uncharacterized protein NESG_00448 [Nematocida ausubeli]KAI5136836.1 hypothetical protein NEAUS07_1722 [Nematocida ausubeli]KAI5149471.1 hypothetical protein NEAUS05_1790 [Nematocida ausubeli]KAI5162221.1 hypothetical protein NEAUS04_0949 [Nematocida ausubeli]KFG27370.1 hypothetical protein NESG_00448 [Nematocida ausubeli]